MAELLPWTAGNPRCSKRIALRASQAPGVTRISGANTSSRRRRLFSLAVATISDGRRSLAAISARPDEGGVLVACRDGVNVVEARLFQHRSQLVDHALAAC